MSPSEKNQVQQTVQTCSFMKMQKFFLGIRGLVREAVKGPSGLIEEVSMLQRVGLRVYATNEIR